MPANPVVLVHGLHDTEHVFRRMSASLRQRGFDVYTLNLNPNNGDAPLEDLAAQLRTFIDSRVGADKPLDIVAFSMGGLVARY